MSGEKPSFRINERRLNALFNVQIRQDTTTFKCKVGVIDKRHIINLTFVIEHFQSLSQEM